MFLPLALAAALAIGPSPVPETRQPSLPLDLSLIGLAALQEGEEGVRASDQGDAGPDDAEGDASFALAQAARPNLRVVGITHQYHLAPDNTCSVIFHVRIQNAGTATAWSLSVGAKGWGIPSLSTCTGTWRAFNTTANLAAGQYRTVTVYGPGYVGPRVLRGTTLTITGFADLHCSVAESNEFDNSRSASIRIGY